MLSMNAARFTYFLEKGLQTASDPSLVDAFALPLLLALAPKRSRPSSLS